MEKQKTCLQGSTTRGICTAKSFTSNERFLST